jgi:endonuclease YncB( thermonuclease family)
LALIVLCLLPGAVGADDRFTAKVVVVADGDTISVLRDGRAFTIRLHGIDCPEDGQDFSARAKQFTSSKAFGKTATIEPRDIDRYGRTVAQVQVEGEDLGLALVRAGLAWHFKRYSNEPELAQAEIAAREARMGLWSHAKPIPPWEYRRRQSLAKAVGPFRGNVRSRVFHRIGCPNYECKNCTQEFGAREEAMRAGFRPAGDCLR